MKTALICDWLTGMRGGERCLEVVCELYPDADIFALVHFPNAVSEVIESHKIYTSYIQKLPVDIKNFRRYLPLFPNAIKKFDLRGYDCILSFSHCVAKNVSAPDRIPHICYCHTPMRYAWHMRSEYLRKYRGCKKWTAEIILNYLKNWDKKTSGRVTHFIANSKNVQNRIREAYGRDSTVIYPPVDCDRFGLSEQNDGYYLIVSALTPYKRIDLAVRAFNNTKRKLLIVGNGPELVNLKALASANIIFIENASDKEVTEYMKKCAALIFPGEEDFGIVPLEAQACGKPVIAYGKGGALETVIGLKHSATVETNATGIFFYEQDPEALSKAVQLLEEKRDLLNARKCRDNALKFNRPIYKQSMQEYIRNVMENPGRMV